MTFTTRKLLTGLSLLALPAALASQAPAMDKCSALKDTTLNHATMDHSMHSAALKDCGSPLPTMPGQAAYGAIGEVVRLLKADPKTDWSRVNMEALRQHLIDMDEVTMRASATQRNVPGGVDITVSGEGRTAAAINRMVVAHAHSLGEGGEYSATAVATPTGARLTVTAKDPNNERLVAQIRGLGFAGLMTEGDHHAPHHIAIARGEADPHAR
jgi:hypothetical protein